MAMLLIWYLDHHQMLRWLGFPLITGFVWSFVANKLLQKWSGNKIYWFSLLNLENTYLFNVLNCQHNMIWEEILCLSHSFFKKIFTFKLCRTKYRCCKKNLIRITSTIKKSLNDDNIILKMCLRRALFAFCMNENLRRSKICWLFSNF